jgi:hypothetical protein
MDYFFQGFCTMSNDLTTTQTSDLALVNFNSLAVFDTQNLKAVDKKSIPMFNQLLQFAPDALLVANTATTKYMVVSSTGPLVAARSGGGFRGFTMGQDGVKSHANLFDPKNLKSLVTLNVAMKAVTMAVGQAHLAEISNKLTEINNKLDDIKEFLTNERASELEAIDKYLEEYFLSANRGFELDDIRRSQLETDTRNIDRILTHFSKDIQSSIYDVTSYDYSLYLGNETPFADLNRLLEKNIALTAMWINCFKIKAKAVQALLLSNEYDLFSQRKKVLLTELDAFQKNELNSLRQVWLSKIDSFDSKVNTNYDLAIKRNSLRDKTRDFIESAYECISGLINLIESINAESINSEVVIEVESGQIVNAYLSSTLNNNSTAHKQNFLSNIGAHEFTLIIPASDKDFSYIQEKFESDLSRDQKLAEVKQNLDEAAESTKEFLNDVGSQLGSFFGRFKR